ncbi:MAG: preprotein translocase subunit YajC [Candidatus Omnitrophica bacterium]|nr:preprotein translocase subunit YajC [Candidatus Omnitrophota bacterium]
MLNAYAEVQGAAAGQASNPIISFLPIVLIFVIFYFLLIKPQKKAQEEHKNMISALKKNDEVITSGGIHGTIVNVKETSVILKIDDNVKIEIQKTTIGTIKKSRQS